MAGWKYPGPVKFPSFRQLPVLFQNTAIHSNQSEILLVHFPNDFLPSTYIPYTYMSQFNYMTQNRRICKMSTVFTLRFPHASDGVCVYMGCSVIFKSLSESKKQQTF